MSVNMAQVFTIMPGEAGFVVRAGGNIGGVDPFWAFETADKAIDFIRAKFDVPVPPPEKTP